MADMGLARSLVSLAEAREAALDLRRQIRKGVEGTLTAYGDDRSRGVFKALFTATERLTRTTL
jgi:hypothetical protein